jgi:hypothetical protein
MPYPSPATQARIIRPPRIDRPAAIPSGSPVANSSSDAELRDPGERGHDRRARGSEPPAAAELTREPAAAERDRRPGDHRPADAGDAGRMVVVEPAADRRDHRIGREVRRLLAETGRRGTRRRPRRGSGRAWGGGASVSGSGRRGIAMGGITGSRLPPRRGRVGRRRRPSVAPQRPCSCRGSVRRDERAPGTPARACADRRTPWG